MENNMHIVPFSIFYEINNFRDDCITIYLRDNNKNIISIDVCNDGLLKAFIERIISVNNSDFNEFVQFSMGKSFNFVMYDNYILGILNFNDFIFIDNYNLYVDNKPVFYDLDSFLSLYEINACDLKNIILNELNNEVINRKLGLSGYD